MPNVCPPPGTGLPPDARKIYCSINPDLCKPPTSSPKPPADQGGDGGDKKGRKSKFTWCDIPPVNSLCDLKFGWDTANGAYNYASKTFDFTSDPLGYVAQALMKGFSWLLGELGQMINKTTQMDWTNQAFLATYTQMFGLATIVTMFLWLLAVVKRMVAGVPPLEAAGESIGYLLLSVVVTAFAPALVYCIHQIFELASDAVFGSVPDDMKSVTETVVKAWGVMALLGGGNVFMTMIGSFLLFAVVGVWVELTVRSALIYLSLAFGPLVLSGLVDNSLWKHIKKWVGFLLGIEASKLVTLTVLKLAVGMLASTNNWSADANDPLKAISVVLTALALLFLAFVAPIVISRFIPAFGDEVATIMSTRKDAHAAMREGGGSDRMQTFADGLHNRADQVSGFKDKIDDWDQQRNNSGSGGSDPEGTGGSGGRTARAGGAEGGAADRPVAGAAAGGAGRGRTDPSALAVADGGGRGAGGGAGRAAGGGFGGPEGAEGGLPGVAPGGAPGDGVGGGADRPPGGPAGAGAGAGGDRGPMIPRLPEGEASPEPSEDPPFGAPPDPPSGSRY